MDIPLCYLLSSSSWLLHFAMLSLACRPMASIMLHCWRRSRRIGNWRLRRSLDHGRIFAQCDWLFEEMLQRSKTIESEIDRVSGRGSTGSRKPLREVGDVCRCALSSGPGAYTNWGATEPALPNPLGVRSAATSMGRSHYQELLEGGAMRADCSNQVRGRLRSPRWRKCCPLFKMLSWS